MIRIKNSVGEVEGINTIDGSVISNERLVFGVPYNSNRIPIEIKDEADFIKMRVRFRNDDFARLWIKTSLGIRAFYLAWTNDSQTYLKPVYEQGSNYQRNFNE